MKRWHILLLDAVLLLFVPVAGFLSNWMLRAIPPCIFAQYGLLCPACGGTRCVKYLVSLKPLMAFKMNPYFFCTALLVGALLILANVAVLSKERSGAALFKKICTPKLLIIWAIGYAVFGILRNFL